MFGVRVITLMYEAAKNYFSELSEIISVISSE